MCSAFNYCTVIMHQYYIYTSICVIYIGNNVVAGLFGSVGAPTAACLHHTNAKLLPYSKVSRSQCT